MADIRAQLLHIFAGYEPEYQRAIAIGPEALPILREMVTEDEDTAASAVYVAAMIGGDDALEIIATAAARADTVRSHAAYALLQFVTRTRAKLQLEAAAEILVQLLDDQELSVRKYAQRAAAAIPDGAHHATGQHRV